MFVYNTKNKGEVRLVCHRSDVVRLCRYLGVASRVLRQTARSLPTYPDNSKAKSLFFDSKLCESFLIELIEKYSSTCNNPESNSQELYEEFQRIKLNY